ncbi:hypothetical protein FB471_1344 [Amycolatopsis cihanbeyliensis]|uniref:Circularly permuted ATP-grasp superfamily protein n=2 Tax=Amycolatopsis cihanbeyliensis TaxID=1128664 RepID=A0A542DF15_AMYCI|nr:hypothetical protein FB471_1344 [Amycolatopsis cihanbeyliensis]
MRRYFDKIGLHSEPYLPTGPVTLSAELGNDLDRASERLLRLLRRTVFEISENPRARHDDLGLDDRLVPLYQDPSLESACATILARPDAILTTDGWQFIEMNVSSAVGGTGYVHLLNEFWRDRISPDLRIRSPLRDRSAMLAATATQFDKPKVMDLVGCTRDIKNDSWYYELGVDDLRRAGFEAELIGIEDYTDSLAGGHAPAPLVLHEFVAQDLLDAGRDLAPAVSLLDPGRIVVSPYSAEHVSNKRALARLSTGPEWLEPADAEFVERYVPWTREVYDGPVLYKSRRRSLVDLVQAQRDRFVLKRSDGSQGNNVHFGSSTDATVWNVLVENAVAAGTWVVQERVHSLGVPVEVADSDGGEASRIMAPSVFGPVLVGGVASGCQVRYDTVGLPGAEVLTRSVPSVLLNCAVWPAR